MNKLSLTDLATVTGGQGSACQRSGKAWTPTPPNQVISASCR
jgi:hypothetical protein